MESFSQEKMNCSHRHNFLSAENNFFLQTNMILQHQKPIWSNGNSFWQEKKNCSHKPNCLSADFFFLQTFFWQKITCLHKSTNSISRQQEQWQEQAQAQQHETRVKKYFTSEVQTPSSLITRIDQQFKWSDDTIQLVLILQQQFFNLCLSSSLPHLIYHFDALHDPDTMSLWTCP